MRRPGGILEMEVRWIMGKTISVEVEVPDALTDETIAAVQISAKECVVITLQQQGVLSIREAAMELGLSYEQYLNRLVESGLPATNGESDVSAMERVRQGTIATS